MTKHVGVYCRLSPRPDGSYEGVDLQEQWGREYAVKTWPGLPVEVFADKGISAANGDERPEFERFRKWVADGMLAAVWTVEQSRLERREAEWFQLAAELDAAGIPEVHTKRDGVVRVRDAVAGIKAVLNAEEIRKLRRRIMDRLDANAAAGQPAGVRPYGYRHARNGAGVKTYEIVAEQADNIRWAAERVIDGWSLTNVAGDLVARGVRGRSGGKVTATTVRGWLTSPSTAGKRVHRGEIVGNGNWPAILDEPTWQAIRTKLGAERTVTTVSGGTFQVTAGHLKQPAGRKYLLTGGLAVCGVCKSKLSGTLTRISNINHATRPYLKCKVKGCVGIALEPTDKHVLDRLWAELDKPEFVAAVVGDDGTERREQITAELGDLNRQRRELARMWAQPGGLTSEEWQAARDELDGQEHRLRVELGAIPAKVEIDRIRSARPAWPHMLLDEQREFLRMFITKVTVNPATRKGPSGFDHGRVVIEWTLR